MDFNYYLADPAGNVTILVENPIDPSRLSEVGTALLSLEKSAEQVGFLSPSPIQDGICLRMAGDEFCGNATLSAGSCRLYMDSLQSGNVPVFVYGVGYPLTVSAQRTSENIYSAIADMPLPVKITDISLCVASETFSFGFVSFGGIAHLITEELFDRTLAESAIKKWCSELGLPALGLMSLNRCKSEIIPLVYVSSLDSLYWEKSCASGTCAAAAFLAENSCNGYFEFTEPGGRLGCEVGNGYLKLHNTVSLERKTLQI